MIDMHIRTQFVCRAYIQILQVKFHKNSEKVRIFNVELNVVQYQILTFIIFVLYFAPYYSSPYKSHSSIFHRSHFSDA